MSLTTTTTDSNEVLANDLLAWLKPKLAETTLYQYSQDLRTFSAFLGKSFLLANQVEIERFIHRPRIGKGLVFNPPSRATSRRELAELRSLYNFLVNVIGILPKNPTTLITVPKSDIDPKPVSDEDWKKLWFADLTDDMRVALGFGYFFGFRRTEICSLSGAHFSKKAPLTVASFRRKGGKSAGIYRIDSHLSLFKQRRPDLIGDPSLFNDALRHLLKTRHDCVALLPWEDDKDIRKATWHQKYPRPVGMIGPKQFNRKLETWCKRTGTSNHITPHMLRHSFCTNLAQMNIQGQILAKLAGHASLATTLVYIKAGEDPLAAYLENNQHADMEVFAKYE